jgi:hypothetical protein
LQSKGILNQIILPETLEIKRNLEQMTLTGNEKSPLIISTQSVGRKEDHKTFFESYTISWHYKTE